MPDMTPADSLALYDMMADTSAEMLRAATAADWDRLVLLEQQCARLLRQVQNGASLALTPQQRQRTGQAIERMLADDKKIRALTQAGMAELSSLINHSGTQRRLNQAYGSV